MSHYSRREFLKFGAALPLALQSLDLRAATAAAAKAPPKRIIFICNSLGFYEPNFFPAKRGDIDTSPYLKDLAVREKMTVFQNLFHPGMDTSNHDSEKSFLTGAPSPEATNFTNTISLDQILAREMGGDTRFPFLSFSIYDRGWGCSWNDRGVAIPPMHDERQIFDKLFGEEDLSAKRRQIENDQHVVKCLYRDMAQLEENGGDQTKIESYRTIIAELEAQLKHEEFWLETKKPEVPDTLIEDQEFAFSAKIRNLFELSKLAFQTDSTRVITISLDWIYGAITVPGATGGWHTLSHHGGKADALEKLSRIEVDVMKHLNEFLSELDGIEEEGGSLLDHTTVVIGSNFGDASNHTCNNLPTIVAGGGYQHQAHTVLEKPTPLCNLYLDLLHQHNVDAGSFGSSTKAMELLKS
ncbi:MAG: DUF1552 domain-containing protein [Akkermansiaceae bacterium]|nr:DUF1552 domain-containing protein [Akkermansiaceae bacterium]NNM28691.1 DUF1552 domain-containing protein [Akkermansiaceae bacterium]